MADEVGNGNGLPGGPSSNRAGGPSGLLLLLLGLVLLAAAVRIWRSPHRASELVVVPDSGEYAIGAQRLATLGRYDLEIGGQAYPPRYPPWFPALLVPAYWIAPEEIGAGIVPVFLLALSGIVAAFRIGRRIAGDSGGLLAAVLLACDPSYTSLSKEILTDVPATAVLLWACELWFARHLLAGGVLVALAASIRMEAATAILPFLVDALRRREGRVAGVLAPSLALAAATAFYQQSAFGDFRRNGYAFWCPVPCDYPGLAFSLEYVPRNLEALTHPHMLLPAIAGAAGVAILLAQRSTPARRLLRFVVPAVLPGVVAHLFFFAAQRRFNLPLAAFADVLGGAAIGSLLPGILRLRLAIPAALLALLPIVVPRPAEEPAHRRFAADAIAAATPGDAVIVTALDPVYLEPLVVRGTRRRIVPAHRDVEYASKVVAWKRIERPDPPPSGPFDHRAAGLLRGGAVDVCPFTADERPDRIAAWVREGVPVYLDRSFLAPKELPAEVFEQHGLSLAKDPDRPWIWKLTAK